MTNNKSLTMSKLARCVVLLWIIVQVVFVAVYWNTPQGNDEKGYMRHALESYEAQTTYPSMLNINDQYLQSPGMVNYLLVQHALTGTVDFNVDKVLNILLNIGIVANLFILARRFFGRKTAYLSVIIYCLLPTNLFAPIWHLSELPYLFLALTGFTLSVTRRLSLIFIASVLFAVAHTFRPLVLAFIVTVIVLYVMERRKMINYILLFLPYVCVLYGIGVYNKSKTGTFVTSSTTGGYNLIMTANDDAKLYADFGLFQDTTNIAYIPNVHEMSFAQKDSIYKARAIEWIKHNPEKYTKLYVLKFGRLWSGDVWSFPVFSQWDDYNYILTQPVQNHGKLVLIRRVIQAVEGLPYYVLVVLFFFSLYKRRREIITQKGLFLLLCFLGTAGTCLFIAEVRFHYPYLFCLVLWTAYGLSPSPSFSVWKNRFFLPRSTGSAMLIDNG